MEHTYYLSLGANLGNRAESLLRAWEMLSPLCTHRRLSQIYETEPMYVTDQPLFLNAAGEAVSPVPPREMLEAIHEIEGDLGRNRLRERRMGPRPIDLDILLCDSMIIDTPDIVIPHPRLAERLFVLIPLREIAPDLRDPRTGVPYAALADSLCRDQDRGPRSARPDGSDDGGRTAGGVYLYRPR